MGAVMQQACKIGCSIKTTTDSTRKAPKRPVTERDTCLNEYDVCYAE